MSIMNSVALLEPSGARMHPNWRVHWEQGGASGKVRTSLVDPGLL